MVEPGKENFMYRKFILIIMALFISPWAYADLLDIQLSNNSARFSYAAEVFGGEFGPTDLEIGSYFNEDNDNVTHVGLLVRNDTLDNPLIISIGSRFYYADVGNQPGQAPADASVLTIGGELLYVPDTFAGFGIGVYYFVAPSVTTFQDADGFTEYGGTINYAITEQASFYIGYRKIEVEIENASDIEVESSFIYGLRMRF